MTRFGLRAWERTGTPPGRARVLVLAVAAATLSVAAVAVVVQRSGDGPDGRKRHGHYAGAVDTAPAAPGATAGAGPDQSIDESAAPAGDAREPSAGSSTTAAVPPAPGGGAPGPGAGAPGEVPVEPPASQAPGKTPGGGQASPGTRPAPPGSTAPGRATATGPAWHLLPETPIDGREGHTAVWTGREMVIWGGMGNFETDPDPFTDGAAFDPATRAWRRVPAAPLAPRFDARAFWTGREMIVLGGTSTVGDVLADGAAWDPATNTWRPVAASPLGRRDGAVVAWAGDRLVVWGGATVPPPDDPPEAETEMRNDGAAYVPATDRWVPVPAAPVPGRSGAESAWTGSRLVISGGYREGDDGDRTDGVALDPLTGAWSPIAARPEPGSCDDLACDGVWTGRGVLFPASGLLYDPAGDRWSVIAADPHAGGPGFGEPVAWTGQRLLVWGTATQSDEGGDDNTVDEETGEAPANAGAAYDPVTDRWDRFAGGPLSARSGHTVIWTGEEMLVWGGSDGDAGFSDGAAYRPV